MLNETISVFYANHFVLLLFIAGLNECIFMHNTFSNNKFSLLNIILFAIFIIIPYPYLFTCNFTWISSYNFNTRTLKDVY